MACLKYQQPTSAKRMLCTQSLPLKWSGPSSVETPRQASINWQCPQKLSAFCLLMSAYLVCGIWCKHTFIDTVAVLSLIVCHTIDHKLCSAELYKCVALPGCKLFVTGNNLCKLQHTYVHACVCRSSGDTKLMCLAFMHAVGLMTCHRNLQTVAMPAAIWAGHQL